MKKGIFDFFSKKILGNEKKTPRERKMNNSTGAAGMADPAMMNDDQFFQQTQEPR